MSSERNTTAGSLSAKIKTEEKRETFGKKGLEIENIPLILRLTSISPHSGIIS